MKRAWFAWAVALVVALLLLVPVHTAFATYAPGWTFTRIAHDTRVMTPMAFDGTQLVWQCPSTAGYDLITQRADQPNTWRWIATSSQEMRAVSVSGDRVVWEGHDGANWQVYTFEVGVDHAPQQVTNDTHDHSGTKLSGDRAVWLGNDGTYDQVFTMKLGTDPAPSQLTTQATYHDQPVVTHDNVAWLDYPRWRHVGYTVMTQNMASGADPVRLTTDGTSNELAADDDAIACLRRSFNSGMWYVATFSLDPNRPVGEYDTPLTDYTLQQQRWTLQPAVLQAVCDLGTGLGRLRRGPGRRLGS